MIVSYVGSHQRWPARMMWRISRGQLDKRYRQLTIGELIERLGSGQTPPV